jgi:hypothetical protein
VHGVSIKLFPGSANKNLQGDEKVKDFAGIGFNRVRVIHGLRRKEVRPAGPWFFGDGLRFLSWEIVSSAKIPRRNRMVSCISLFAILHRRKFF